MMWSRTALWVVIMVMVLGNPVNALEKCTIHYYNISKYYDTPFLVDTERKEIIYPDIGEQSVTLNSGTTVLASCPGTGNNLFEYSENSMNITCNNSRLLIDHNQEIQDELKCEKKIESALEEGNSCGENSSMYYISWEILPKDCFRQISVCFNKTLETTVFVKHKIHGRFIGVKMDSCEVNFSTDELFAKNPDFFYKKKEQRKILRSLNRLHDKTQHFLSKGHLAPVADFVLKAEKRATYHYINIVPQWETINNGNWNRLESSVREMAKEQGTTLNVYTGTHGILKLPDGNGRPTEMLLGKKKMPVPALMWKVIHNPAEHTAVAIVMVNDVKKRPWSDSWSLSRCSIKCSDLHWIKRTIPSVTKGQLFCCKVDELRSNIPEVPDLHDVHPLM